MARTVLVCFPHVDDETPVVGTMVKHVERGDRVVLVFATYGEMTSLFGEVSPKQIRKEREAHAERLAAIIGCEVRFLGFADAGIGTSRDEALQLAALIAELKPDAIVTYNPVRGHPDHRHLSELLRDAVTYARLPRLVAPAEPHREPVAFYVTFEPTSPYPAVFIDVTEHMEPIKAVMEIYADAYDWSVEGIVERRKADGAASGVEYAEKLSVMQGPQPAVDFLVQG